MPSSHIGRVLVGETLREGRSSTSGSAILTDRKLVMQFNAQLNPR